MLIMPFFKEVKLNKFIRDLFFEFFIMLLLLINYTVKSGDLVMKFLYDLMRDECIMIGLLKLLILLLLLLNFTVMIDNLCKRDYLLPTMSYLLLIPSHSPNHSLSLTLQKFNLLTLFLYNNTKILINTSQIVNLTIKL